MNPRIHPLVLSMLCAALGTLGAVGCSKKSDDETKPAPTTTTDQAPGPNAAKAPTTPGAEAPEPAITSRLPQPERDLADPDGERREAVFAGGCYWCVEAIYEMFDGVEGVVSGYAGGTAEDANYPRVSTGETGHAEVVKVTYDPAKISYATLLRIFMATHEPTSLNKQGADVGPQYRSAVFYQSDDEKAVVQAYIDQLNEAKVFDKPIVTTLEPLETFYEAEPEHQDYARRNPKDPYITEHLDPMMAKAKREFAPLVERE